MRAIAVRVGGVLLIAAMCLASASAPGKHTVNRTTTVKASYDDTWTAVIDVFADRNWPISSMAKDSGLIATDWMRVDAAEAYADCGGSGIARTHGTYVRFNVRVKSGNTTEVTVNASFREARSFDGQSGFADCESKGAIELQIHSDVKHRAATAKKTAPVERPPAATARGYFCATSATAGLCAREKRDCLVARDAAVAAVPDLGSCALVEAAFCFDAGGRERCFPTAEQCATRANGAECGERK